MEKLLALPIRVASEASSHARMALELLAIARDHQLTAYDGSYLHLARTRALALASEDKALMRAAGATGVRLVGD